MNAREAGGVGDGQGCILRMKTERGLDVRAKKAGAAGTGPRTAHTSSTGGVCRHVRDLEGGVLGTRDRRGRTVEGMLRREWSAFGGITRPARAVSLQCGHHFLA